MSKKILAVVMAAAMAMTGLAGCQGKGTSTAATGETTVQRPLPKQQKLRFACRIRRRLISIRRLRSLQNVRKNIQAAL